MKNALVFSLFICFFCSTSAFSQEYPTATADSTSLYKVNTKDGNEFTGTLVSQDSDRIVLKTTIFGNLSILKKNITSIRALQISQIRNGNYWLANAHNTRYFFQSNGYGLKKGEGYYQNTWLVLNQLYYGFSDRLTIGFGTAPLSFFGDSDSPIWVAPKYSVSIVENKLNVGAGALFGVLFGSDGASGGTAILYGTATAGPRDRNVSLGLGYGYGNGEWAKAPLVSLSGIFRTGPKFAFISENYFFTITSDIDRVYSFGGRFFGKKVAVDLAMIWTVSRYSYTESVSGRPWLTISVPFFHKKRVNINPN